MVTGTMDPMRVLRISHSAVVRAWRGRERALRDLGHDVRLLSAREWDEGGRSVPLVPDAGEDVVGVRTFGRHPNVFLYDPRPIWRALGEDWDLIDLHEEPCALATAEVLALRALRRVRTPYVLYSAQNIAKRYPVPFRWWERRALRDAAGVSVCNTEAAAILRGKGLTAPVHVIGLGVDVDRFSPAPGAGPAASGATGPTRAAPAGRPVHVGYVGRLLAPHKGLDVLLDAAELEPRLRIAIAGGGPHEAALRARAQSPLLTGRVSFDGHLSGDALIDFYRGIDVAAVPSVAAPGWLEQFGRVAVEAMASGVPVVASDSGALPDVVGGAGTLVPPGDAGALAAALTAVLDEPGRADRMRADGLARSRRYTWEAVGGEYEALYRAALAGPHAPGPHAADHDDPEVVVVAYHSPELLARALAPLAVELPVTVVDNSGDPEVRRVAADAGARYIDPGANLGFGSAIDLVLLDRQRPGADLLLLNPDARIDAAAVRALHRHLRAEPDLAAVGPAQTDDAGNPARVLWPFPTPAGVWRQEVGLGVRSASDGDGFVIGSVLLLRAEALEQVGAFDEAFFLYSEETDWQRRARSAGWRSAVVPGVGARHVGAATSTDPVRRDTHFHASQERYFRKHHGPTGWALVRAAVVLGSLARSPLPGDRGLAARRRLRLYLDGPLRAEAALGDPRAPRTSAALSEAA